MRTNELIGKYVDLDIGFRLRGEVIGFVEGTAERLCWVKGQMRRTGDEDWSRTGEFVVGTVRLMESLGVSYRDIKYSAEVAALLAAVERGEGEQEGGDMSAD